MLRMFGVGSLQVHLTMRRPRAVTTTLLLICVSVSAWSVTAHEHTHACVDERLRICLSVLSEKLLNNILERTRLRWMHITVSCVAHQEPITKAVED